MYINQLHGLGRPLGWYKKPGQTVSNEFIN